MADTNRFYSTKIFGAFQVSDGADATASAIFDRDMAVKGVLTVGNETSIVDPSLGIVYTRSGGINVRVNGVTVSITPSQVAQLTNSLATTGDIAAAVSALVAASPATLNTLSELAAALGNDPNFATTITTALGGKAPLVSAALSGVPTAPTPSDPLTNSTQIATTAHVRNFIRAIKTSSNEGFGGQTLNGITTGSSNTAVGSQAGFGISDGTNNVAVGTRSMYTTGASYVRSIAVGEQSHVGFNVASSIAVGYQTCYNSATTLGTLTNAIVIGASSMSNYVSTSTPGSSLDVVAIGHRIAFNTASTLIDVIAVGSYALTLATTARRSISIGTRSLANITSQTDNTAVGFQAGQRALTTGCTFLGSYADASPVGSTYSFSTALGYGAQATDSNQIVLGRATEEVQAPGGLRMGENEGVYFADGTLQTTAATTSADVGAAIATATATLAPLASPALTGAPTCPTAPAGDNSTSIANTSFVTTALTPYLTAAIAASTYLTSASISGLATLASPALTGVPTVPNASAGTSTTQIASTSFVSTAISGLLSAATAAATYATKVSPVLSGTPSAPTAAAGTNTTQLATTAFVTTALGSYLTAATAAATYLTSASISALAPLASPSLTGNPTAPTQAQSVIDTTLATTAYVYNSRYNTLLRGTPTLETTPPTFDGSLKIATTAHVRNQLNDTNLTGTPVAPTPSGSDRSNKIATTNSIGLALIDTVLSGTPTLATVPGSNDNTSRLASTSHVAARAAALLDGTSNLSAQPVRGSNDLALANTRWVANYAKLQLMRTNIPAWLLDGTVATKGGYVQYAILCSTARLGLIDSDDLWLISPGFTLVGYDTYDYGGSAWVIGSCSIDAVRATVPSNTLSGGNNRIASVKVYFTAGALTWAAGEPNVGSTITLPDGSTLQYAQEFTLSGIS